MSSLEMNKVAGAVLTAGVIAMLSGFIAETLMHPHELEEPVYLVAGAEPAEDSGGEAPAGPEPVLPLLAAADPAAGEGVAKKCTACHSFDEGGANKVGPNLWGVVNAPIAAHDGFNYSDALLDHSEETWTYEHLNAFLHKPNDFAPGTKMTFAGISKVSDRADLIAYLRTLAGSPAPLPTDEEIAAVQGGGEEAAAEGGEEAAAEEPAAEEPAAEEAPAEEAEGDQAASDEAAGDEPGATQTAEAGAADSAGGGFALSEMVANADPEAAKKVSRKCTACHSFEEGGANKVGPNLYGVIGRAIASHEGFNYSDALKEKSDQAWTYENLAAFLQAPKDFAPGTKMTFAGLRKDEDLAAMIAFLRSYHDEPVPALP